MSIQWQFAGISNKWTVYDDKVQKMLESAYQARRSTVLIGENLLVVLGKEPSQVHLRNAGEIYAVQRLSENRLCYIECGNPLAVVAKSRRLSSDLSKKLSLFSPLVFKTPIFQKAVKPLLTLKR